MPGVDPKVIRAALKLWTSTTSYLNALQARVERIDLYGAPAGEVSDRDQAGAQQWLNVLFAQRRRRESRERRAMLARLAGNRSS